MEIDQTRFDEIKSEAEKTYKTFGDVLCPYLHSNVTFNSKGLEHLKFKDRNKARSIQDQYIRLRLLKLAAGIISKSHTLQEYYETNHMEKINTNSQWTQRMVKVRYYGFISIVNNTRIKVIVKQIQEGKKFFWSIIPFWKNDIKNTYNKKILHAGDLEND